MSVFWISVILLFILLIILIVSLLSNIRIPTSSCAPDIPVDAGLLTSAPADISHVHEVIPLGNLNPGGGHVLSVDHMYLAYPQLTDGGNNSYPVKNMAAGQLFMLYRDQKPDRTDYQIFIKHTCSVYSYFDHLHRLSSAIEDYLSTNGVTWTDMSGSEFGPWMIFLGQSDGAAMMPLASGEQVGNTQDYSYSWDVGLVDTRQTNGVFANTSASRYPTYSDYAQLFPSLGNIDLSIYNLGNKMLNAACFIDYMDSNLQTAWHAKLASDPQGCGTVGWDTLGYLRGAWFNPDLDMLPLRNVLMDHEVAAFSIIPDNRNPTTRIQIGIGNAATATISPSLALLDPVNWTPSISAPQIERAFFIDIDTTAGAIVNPDPADIGPGVTVCYDLEYEDHYNSILLHMTDATHLKIKYDPTESSSKCSTLAANFPPPDATWFEYVR